MSIMLVVLLMAMGTANRGRGCCPLMALVPTTTSHLGLVLRAVSVSVTSKASCSQGWRMDTSVTAATVHPPPRGRRILRIPTAPSRVRHRLRQGGQVHQATLVAAVGSWTCTWHRSFRALSPELSRTMITPYDVISTHVRATQVQCFPPSTPLRSAGTSRPEDRPHGAQFPTIQSGWALRSLAPRRGRRHCRRQSAVWRCEP